jgi:hypothetical protein
LQLQVATVRVQYILSKKIASAARNVFGVTTPNI